MVKKKSESIKLEEYVISQTNLSRRGYFDCLKQGKIKVNGHIISDITHRIQDTKQNVEVDGQMIQKNIKYDYFLFNKPKGMLATMTDTKNRLCIGDIIREQQLTVTPVGRLDRQTTGLMILTNDGDLAHFLMHPKHNISKTYRVTLDQDITKANVNRLLAGIILEDGPVLCVSVELLATNQLHVVITEGRNRIIRRLFQHLGYTVTALKRISIGPVQLATLKSGELKKINRNKLPKIKQLDKQ